MIAMPFDPVLYAIPVFILTVLGEFFVIRQRKIYNVKDAMTSIAMGLGNVFQSVIFAGLIWSVTLWSYSKAPFHFPKTWWTFLLLFLTEDFCYYWFHRLSHEIRFWWAAHVNHHSSEYYNLSTALRQHWTGNVVMTWIVWLPLSFMGLPPDWILIEKSVSLLYQYWIHTELIQKMPPWFEFIFNTPSHHRVHHASNTRYLDCNYAGILIIWDRMFGTFIAENVEEPVKYGLTKNIHTYHLGKVAFHEWIQIFKDVAQAKSFREVWYYVMGPPGWSRDGLRKEEKR